MLSIFRPAISSSCLICAFCLAACWVQAANAAKREDATDKYPLSTELKVLERDLSNPDYRTVLATMIPTDLAAEWQRVATSDNYLAFAEQHGGPLKVLADPTLRVAYERRKRIADSFLTMIREAYSKRHIKPGFDNGTRLEQALRSTLSQGKENRTAAPIALRAVLPAEGAEHQWPRLRGPDGQGTAPEAQMPLHWSPTENIVWKTEISGSGNSSPVVWNDRIFITSASADGASRKILCYSRGQGKLLWEHAAGPSAGKEWVYRKNSYASSTVVTDGQRVIAFFASSGLVCVDFDGHEQWHVDLGAFPTMHGAGASPLLYRNEVICIQYQSKGKSLFAAFDKRTGAKLWQHDRPNAMCWSTPVVIRVGDRDDLVYNGSDNLIGYDPEKGTERWRVSGTSGEAIPTVVVGGGLLFSASGRNGPTMAIRPHGSGDLTATAIVWRNLRGGPHVPSPLYSEGRLYIVNDTGIATCLDAADGRTIWQHRLRGRFSMSPIGCRDRILVTNEDGHSTIFKAADTFAELAECDLDEPVLATPALVNDRLYFRSASHLWCIGGSEASRAAALGPTQILGRGRSETPGKASALK
jgi:outer membrane protein assembly factor BamB